MYVQDRTTILAKTASSKATVFQATSELRVCQLCANQLCHDKYKLLAKLIPGNYPMGHVVHLHIHNPQLDEGRG